MFEKITDRLSDESEYRKWLAKNKLRYGVKFLDDALRCILADDLILIGALSGAGKSQLCSIIALANMNDGRRVNYIPLESSEFEVQQRLLYPLVMDRYYGDPGRVRVGRKIEFEDWLTNEFQSVLEPYERDAQAFFEKAYGDLWIHRKDTKFGMSELIKSVTVESRDASLIIVDHAQYFDFDDDNENRAMKDLAKTCRNLVLEERKPIILISHMRKRERGGNKELAPGMEEFHGSSDLYKIATRVITLAPGRPSDNGGFETFFRVSKNRFGGGVTRYLARCIYSPQKGAYEHEYKIGWSDQSKFGELAPGLVPDWANNGDRPGIAPSSYRHANAPRSPELSKVKNWAADIQGGG